MFCLSQKYYYFFIQAPYWIRKGDYFNSSIKNNIHYSSPPQMRRGWGRFEYIQTLLYLSVLRTSILNKGEKNTEEIFDN
ncbi:MAG TPA: hypothetical protein DEA43_04280 [Candidatus Moranbacteria bacterium]|nr:hypothetical protein [Candidatus Moranbacteria bacterium]